MDAPLKWSTQLHVATDSPARLHGDKITLPQSALEALLAAAPFVPVESRYPQRQTSDFDPFNPYSFAAERQARGYLTSHQQQLPQPLTFRLVNATNGRVVYAGIREFSAEEGEIGLSNFLVDALGLASKVEARAPNGDMTNGDIVMSDKASALQVVTVHAEQIAKGTYVRLRPLEAGYDPEDWKSLLERYLRDNFTTLTNGEILEIPGARHEHFRFLVDKLEPEGHGICIVDTDLEVDIEALNEEQARETLNRRLEKARRAPGTATGSSPGGLITVNQELHGQVLPGEYVDYELKDWDKAVDLELRLDGNQDSDVDLLINAFSARQRSKPRLEEHTFANLCSRPSKRLKIAHSNAALENAESLYIAVRADSALLPSSSQPLQFTLTVTTPSSLVHSDIQEHSSDQLGDDEVRCKNCQQAIPKRTVPLHEAFCYRNNIVCPECKDVFLKNSDAWKSHWHCPHDGYYGNDQASQQKHNNLFHPKSPLHCPACGFEAFDMPILAQHRTTTCPGKEILCQFCHLVVPQQGPEDPSFTDAEVLLSGLTPHEVSDGARTTECHLCGKIVKLQNMATHMKLHDRDRILRPRPSICVNAICGRSIKTGRELQTEREQAGLCEECYGPLHGTAYDPEGKALRRRVERRLLQQLMGGCGKSWCHNDEWCRTGKKNSTGHDVAVTARDALPMVRPLLDQLNRGDSNGLRFCVDEAAQSRRSKAEMLAAENVYDLEWCVKALEEERNKVSSARDWLKDRAPKKDEVV